MSPMRQKSLVLWIALFSTAVFPASAQNQPSSHPPNQVQEAAEIRGELEQLKKDYANRIGELELRLTVLEARSDAPTPEQPAVSAPALPGVAPDTAAKARSAVASAASADWLRAMPT